MHDERQSSAKVIDEQSENDHNWQHVWHNVLNRRATPLMYDWLYNWMTQAIRGIIADSTAGIWAQGKYTSCPWRPRELLAVVDVR